jgi:membrane-associated phospholipid phosphatase
VFPRDNILTDGVKLLYSLDTNTNVCPSLHVGYSIGIASVWLKTKDTSTVLKIAVTIFCILVCLSTVFIKQHSALDALVALPMCFLAEIVSCHGYWKDVFRKKSA